MTDPSNFSGLGCNHAVAIILARQIDAGQCDPNALCGVSFCDYEAVEIARQVNSGLGSTQPLEALGVLPELAKAIAGAINAISKEQQV